MAVGSFSIQSTDEEFESAGAIGPNPVIALPRTSVRILPEGRLPFLADPTQLNLYSPWQSYRRESVGLPRYASDWVEIDRQYFRDSGVAPPSAARLQFAEDRVACSRQLYLRVRLTIRSLELGWGDPLLVEETLIGLAEVVARSSGLLGSPSGDDEPLPRNRERVEAIKEILVADPGGEHRIDDLADTVECSKFHLCRVFRAATGQTIHGFLTDLRLRLSLERIAESHGDLASIALELGFSNHSHFSDSFRRAFGTTPSRFRRIANRDGIDPLG